MRDAQRSARDHGGGAGVRIPRPAVALGRRAREFCAPGRPGERPPV